jgi:transcriptional regulator with XRE-family HTH domain
MPFSSEHEYFGRYLQAIRLEKKITLAQVAEETRIGTATLEAIENEDLGRLPPEVFLKGFLRAYAKAIGADPAEAVRRCDRQRSARNPADRAELEPQRARPRQGRRLAAVLALLTALVLATLLAFQHWGGRPADTAAPAAADRLAAAEARPGQVPSAPVPPAAAGPSQGAAAPKYVLTISAREASWVKVVVDQSPPAEHELKAGDRLRLEAQTKFNLLIGNAGGVTLVLNDKPVHAPGKRGEIVNIHLP